MSKYEVGMLVKSKAGHDVGRLYVIIGPEGEYLYLSDGHFRPLSKPKRKNQKHIQVINKKIDMQNITDADIKKLLKTAIKEGE
ncbi:MAG: KOW domain-containing RNA-binding protein [Lachnospiraceae bacterium]